MSSSHEQADLDALRVHFGRELRRLRQRADLSMNQLAETLGCTPQWIHQLEKTDKSVPEHAQSPYVQVRIMPFVRITPASLTGSFILLSFEKEADLMYVESGAVSLLLEAKDQIFAAGVRFDTIMGEALSQVESIELMERVREVYE